MTLSDRDAWFALCDIDGESDFSFQDLIASIEQLVDAERSRLSDNKLARYGDSEIFRLMIEEEVLSSIESLLGVSLVMQQIRMAGSLGKAQVLAKGRGRTFGNYELLALGRQVEGTEWSVARGIWELANFFKHRDEWTDWALSGRNGRTIEVIVALGCGEAFSNNLELGIRGMALERCLELPKEYAPAGVFDGKHLLALELAVSEWKSMLQRFLAIELGITSPYK